MVDRSVDLISPFCMQMNYEGLLDEIFGISTTCMQADRTIIHPEMTNDKGNDGQILKDKLTIKLTNNDSLFKRVRDCSLPGLGVCTNSLLKDLQNIKDTQGDAQSIKEMSEYLTRVKQMNVAETKGLLDCHTNLATHINRMLKTTE